MKLDRNQNPDGLGKYAILALRELADIRADDGSLPSEIRDAIATLDNAGIIQWGRVGEEDEFFLVKLRDVNAPGALEGYAQKANTTDPEFAAEVRSMLSRAGSLSPFCKTPD